MEVQGTDRNVIRYYLGEWGRLIRIDGTMCRYGSTPLAQAVGGEVSVSVEDPVMERVFHCMAQIKQVYPVLYRYQRAVYVGRIRVAALAQLEGCSTRNIHQWLAKGEDYLWFYMRGSCPEAQEALDAEHEEISRKRPKQKEKIVYPRWGRQTLHMPGKKSD